MNFKLLSGEQFESLVEEILVAKGFQILSRPARGPDQGCDILAARDVLDDMGISSREIWLVECKNNAVSGKSVKTDDIGNFELKMRQHKANRYLLANTTIASETVKQQFKALSEDESINRKAIFWSGQDVIRLLDDFNEIRMRYQPWHKEAEKLCEHINGTHQLMANHRGVMEWGDGITAVYGNDGYDPRPGEPISKYVKRTRRQVEIFENGIEKKGFNKLAFAKSKNGVTWVILVESNDINTLSAFIQASFMLALEEQMAEKG
ncbi:restriction endonuclease [Aeromonas salmonicida]|uniref:restriction endonuclease n=1 Tax=Aeromonas salmonicida TaxID=645 RepID=UPI003D1ADEC2